MRKARMKFAAVLLASIVVVAGTREADGVDVVERSPTEPVVFETSLASVRPSVGTVARDRTGRKRRRGWKPAHLRSTVGPGKVFGSDDREIVIDTEADPWSTVCVVHTRSSSGAEYAGSAVMIGPRHALTAAHVVYDLADGGWMTDVDVIPAYRNGRTPFGTAKAARMMTFRGWTESEDFEYDMALLELDWDIGEYTGWLGLWAAEDADLLGTTLSSAGYPGDRPYGESAGEYMYATSGACRKVTEYFLKYKDTFDMWSGQSGSGLWVLDEGDEYVVGINAWDTWKTNAGTRLTETKFAYIDAWIDGYPFPADLRVAECTASFSQEDGEVAPGAPGSVVVRVANDGGAPATSTVTLLLRPPVGDDHVLATEPISLAAGASTVRSIAVSVPQSAGGGMHRIVAVVNRDDLTTEASRLNNELEGPTITVPGPWLLVPTDRPVSDRLTAGEQMRYRFVVPAGAKKLQVRFRGWRWSLGYVQAPGGERYVIEKTRGTVRFRDPAEGEWRLLITAEELAEDDLHKAKIKVKMPRRRR